MILYDSDYATIYKQMSEEREKVRYYSRKFQAKAFKSWKHKRPPCLYYEIQTMPKSHNTYLHYYYAMKEAEIKNNCCFFGNLLLVNGDDGKQMAVRLSSFVARCGAEEYFRTDSLQIFTGHFFSRYRERYTDVIGLSSHELIATFAGRNLGYLQPLEYDSFVLNKQENGAAWGIDDGVSLGETEWIDVGNKQVMVAKHKTFIGRQMLKEEQEKESLSRDDMRAMLMHHFK